MLQALLTWLLSSGNDRTATGGTPGSHSLFRARHSAEPLTQEERKIASKRIAVISDIHGNLEALEAVLADIRTKLDLDGGDRIWCLGDIVGFGPNPVECIDMVAKHCELSLMGDHDFSVLYEPTNLDKAAEGAAYWTRRQFEEEAKRDREGAVKRWEFLGKLHVRASKGPFLCVHGTPRRPINEYLFPEDAENSPNKMHSIFEHITDYCLVGHTHVPGVFTGDGDFYSPNELCDATWEFKQGEKVIVNPGSVGQPRDLDPRASYAILDMNDDGIVKTVKFFRLAYDAQKVADKIRSIPQLSDSLGDRLLEGR